MLVGVRLTGLPAGQLSGWATSLVGPTFSLGRLSRYSAQGHE